MTEPTDEADTELMPARVYAESWPDTDREDTFWYQPTGAGIDMRTGAASKITVYIREDVCAADIARLQSELTEWRKRCDAAEDDLERLLDQARSELAVANERVAFQVDNLQRLHKAIDEAFGEPGGVGYLEHVSVKARELAAAKAELADAQRGDPDGHLLAVYQVLTGSQDAGELFDGEEPHYERVIQAAKAMRAERDATKAEVERFSRSVCEWREKCARQERRVLDAETRASRRNVAELEAEVERLRAELIRIRQERDHYREKALTTPPAPGEPSIARGLEATQRETADWPDWKRNAGDREPAIAIPAPVERKDESDD